MECKGYCDHKKVEQLGRMNFTGNIVPMNWYKTITRENGKPDQTAITLLSEIVYWYRPTEIRDESSGEFIGFKKRFHDEQYLQKSYNDLADTFGFGYQEVQRAIKRLEELGVIQRIVRHAKNEPNRTYTILYIDIHPERLAELTYNKPEEMSSQPLDPNRAHSEYSHANAVKYNESATRTLSESETRNRGNTEPNNGHIKVDDTPYQMRQGGTSEMKAPPIRRDSPSLSDAIGQIHRLHTKTTGTKSSSSVDTGKDRDEPQVDVMMKKDNKRGAKSNANLSIGEKELRERARIFIRNNVEYSTLIQNEEASLVDEIVEIIVDTICKDQQMIRVNGGDVPADLVKSQFMKLTSRHIECVLQNLQHIPNKIVNINAYLVATLYNVSISLKLNQHTTDTYCLQQYYAAQGTP